jgi:hypothetical protein
MSAWFKTSLKQLAPNVQGLLLWRTSKVMNVRSPSGVTYFKTPRGRAEPWQQIDVVRSCANFESHLIVIFLLSLIRIKTSSAPETLQLENRIN